MMLDVWDERLAAAGEAMGTARLSLVHDLAPYVDAAYKQLSRRDDIVSLRYEPAWFSDGLESALVATRNEDLRRGTSLVGPHRDDVVVILNGVPSRSHASQGEQRTLALALRLGVHLLLTERHGESPLLLLDDVFSELDRFRTEALFEALPPGQAVLTTAVALPQAADAACVLEAQPGTVRPMTGPKKRDSGRARRAWTPLPTASSAPTPLRGALDNLASTLGLTNVDSINALFLDWTSIVGEELATHCKPRSLRDQILTIEASDQQWATELKWMTGLLIERCCEALGDDAVVDVRITR